MAACSASLTFQVSPSISDSGYLLLRPIRICATETRVLHREEKENEKEAAGSLHTAVEWNEIEGGGSLCTAVEWNGCADKIYKGRQERERQKDHLRALPPVYSRYLKVLNTCQGTISISSGAPLEKKPESARAECKAFLGHLLSEFPKYGWSSQLTACILLNYVLDGS